MSLHRNASSHPLTIHSNSTNKYFIHAHHLSMVPVNYLSKFDWVFNWFVHYRLIEDNAQASNNFLGLGVPQIIASVSIGTIADKDAIAWTRIHLLFRILGHHKNNSYSNICSLSYFGRLPIQSSCGILELRGLFGNMLMMCIGVSRSLA